MCSSSLFPLTSVLILGCPLLLPDCSLAASWPSSLFPGLHGCSLAAPGCPAMSVPGCSWLPLDAPWACHFAPVVLWRNGPLPTSGEAVLCRSGHLPKRRLAEARSRPTGLGRRPNDGNSFACVFANFRVEAERQPAMETKNATLRKRARDPPAAIQPHQPPRIKHAIQQTHFNEQVSKFLPRESGSTSRVFIFLVFDTRRVEACCFEVRWLYCLCVQRLV